MHRRPRPGFAESELWDLLLFSRKVLSDSCDPMGWAVALQAPLSTGFPRQEYQNGLPFPSPGHVPDSGIKPTCLALAGRFFTTEPPGKPFSHQVISDSLRPHGLQQCRLPCPSPSPRVFSDPMSTDFESGSQQSLSNKSSGSGVQPTLSHHQLRAVFTFSNSWGKIKIIF